MGIVASVLPQDRQAAGDPFSEEGLRHAQVLRDLFSRREDSSAVFLVHEEPLKIPLAAEALCGFRPG